MNELMQQKELSRMMKSYKWMGVNSITYGSGMVVLMDVRFFDKEHYYIAPIADTTVASYLKYNQDNLTNYDVLSTADSLVHTVGVGEGTMEEEGIIYVKSSLDSAELIWFAFFEESGPFNGVTIEDKVVTATTVEGAEWIIPIDDPLKIKIINH